jgi:hypothetical protein
MAVCWNENRFVPGCPLPERERCNDSDPARCSGGGADEPCRCFPCHAGHLNFRAAPEFVGIDRSVMHGLKCVAVACSHTFAKRIARVLNEREMDKTKGGGL